MVNKHGVSGFTPDEMRDDPFAFNWLGAEVEFKMLGQTARGNVTEAMGKYNVCTPHWLVVEFYDGNKQVKVGGHHRGFKKVQP